MRPRIYTDTSVIGGCLDVEFEHPSRLLLQQFRDGKAVLVLSNLTHLELELAPEQVKDMVATVNSDYIEEVEFTQEAAKLSEEYISAGVIGRSSLTDARHIATATVHNVTVLVSWNFKHIVNLERIHGYNSVNIRHGYSMLEIRTPREVIGNED